MGCCESIEAAPNADHVDHTHFEIFRCIGKGGFGNVYAVQKKTDPEGKRDYVAMKKMAKVALMKSEWHMKVAWLERNVLRAVNSPFVPKLYWAFQDQASLYLVMEFLPGGDLGFYISRQNGLPESTVAFYMAELALGIEELHKRRIVHHDIKPANILLDKDGHSRITDFGIAVFLEQEQELKCKSTAGTPGFMSPEAVKGRSHGVETDFFSFGASLYYCFKGRCPFEDNNEMLAQRAIPQSMSHIPAAARDLILKLLKYDVSDRLVDWDAVKKDPFFSGINWSEIAQRTQPGPITIDKDAASNFPVDVYAMDVLCPDEVVKVDDKHAFDGYEYDYQKVAGASEGDTLVKRLSRAARKSVSVRRKSNKSASPGKGTSIVGRPGGSSIGPPSRRDSKEASNSKGAPPKQDTADNVKGAAGDKNGKLQVSSQQKQDSSNRV
ncbi:Protein kinase domain-containing protein [Plasmodiophora brassicae]|uniref:Protein kinase domain-containing protein n=1 Tax=Plasmodiophora brassicae TaxID=37360 RepID=A0A3P3YLZ8_PLABS|nr:unnamed protein product [Plasmodiophora brassicae]